MCGQLWTEQCSGGCWTLDEETAKVSSVSGPDVLGVLTAGPVCVSITLGVGSGGTLARMLADFLMGISTVMT